MEHEQVAQLVKRLRRMRGLTQGQLAQYAGVTRSWLSRVESGSIVKPEREMLEELARVLHASANTLLSAAGYRVTPLPPPSPRLPTDILRELETAIREQGPIMVYPAADQVISAGQGAPLAEPIAYYPRPGERGHRFTWVKVVGTCMEPEIKDGSIAIVDEDASAHPGNIVAAIHDGEALVKRLERHDGDLYLVALRDRPAVKVDADTHIIGVVTFTGKWV